jgi:serine/threonine protein kinase
MTPLGAGEYCCISACSLGGERVAVKMLKPEKHLDPIAISDLARETRLLANMRHANLIVVVAQGTYAHSLNGELISFLCLEVLASTLSAELPSSSIAASPWGKMLAARAWPLSRSIDVAVQIARAMRYCHDDFIPGCRLLHRDLKPNNVGFAASGRVVLFDFGLCKLWSTRSGGDDEYDLEDLRQLTGLTGSLRYMAPEVALCKPYNHKADVFSFGSVSPAPLAVPCGHAYIPHSTLRCVATAVLMPLIRCSRRSSTRWSLFRSPSTGARPKTSSPRSARTAGGAISPRRSQPRSPT